MRKIGWEKLLEYHLRENTQKVFKWGVCDCVIFISDWCKIACGVDPMSYNKEGDPITIRGLYDSEDTAYNAIKKYRGNIENIMDTHFQRIPASRAGRGDVVLQRLTHGLTFGIVESGGVCYFKCEGAGLYPANVKQSVLAWRIE